MAFSLTVKYNKAYMNCKNPFGNMSWIKLKSKSKTNLKALSKDFCNSQTSQASKFSIKTIRLKTMDFDAYTLPTSNLSPLVHISFWTSDLNHS